MTPWIQVCITVVTYLRNSKHHRGPDGIILTDQSARKH